MLSESTTVAEDAAIDVGFLVVSPVILAVVGNTGTVADILMTLTLNEVKDASLFEPYTHVRSYRDRCLARAAWRRTFDSYRARVEAT